MKYFSLCLIAIIIAGCASLNAQNTMRGKLRNAPAATETSAAIADTVKTPGKDYLNISGYDKPLRSRRETFFVSNNHRNKALVALTVTLVYSDKAGRMLHKAESRTINCLIPAGETRQVNIPSWDIQQNFYYTRSQVPTRVEQATPYDVKIDIEEAIYEM